MPKALIFGISGQDGAYLARLLLERGYTVAHIADFIAGMTDRYAITRHCAVVGPVTLPEGF